MQQKQVLESLRQLAQQDADEDAGHSIMELQGFGKEIWRSIDVDSYMNQERDSWAG